MQSSAAGGICKSFMTFTLTRCGDMEYVEGCCWTAWGRRRLMTLVHTFFLLFERGEEILFYRGISRTTRAGYGTHWRFGDDLRDS